MTEQDCTRLSTKEVLEAFGDTAVKLLPGKIREYGDMVFRRCEIEDKFKYDEVCLRFALQSWEQAVGFKELERAINTMTRIKGIGGRKNRHEIGMMILPLEEVKQVSILDAHDFAQVKRTGQRVMVTCPWHTDKTPSMLINKNNTFKCFSCGKAGSVIDFVMYLYGFDFISAVKFLQGKRNETH